MASQAVKGKRKVKGKTLDLNTFLGEDQDAPSGFAVVNTRRIDWGDAMENEDLDDRYTMDFKKDEKVVLPTAPKATRGPDVDVTKIPTRPPYTAFLGNLPYDVSEEDISQFFRQLQVTNVRLPRENGDKNGRIKGFGYAEFQNRENLIQALALNNESMKSRAIKVSLAGEHDGDRDRRGGSDGGPDRTLGDWRSGGSARDEPPRSDSYQSNRGFSDRDRGRSNYGDKDYSNFSRGDRFERNERNGDRYDRNDSFRNNDRDFGRDQDRRSQDSRGYGFSSDKGMSQRSGMGSGGRMERRDGGGGGRDYGSNFGRREDSSRDSRYTDSSDRYPPSSRDNFERKESRPSYDPVGGSKERPRLQLAPRTKPIEPTPPPSEATASSIFGGAKPVDTAAREREIEERLERERDAPSNVRDREPPKERSEEARTRRFSTGSGVSNRSRRSSDSGPPEYDECVPQHKPPLAANRQMDADKEQHSSLPRSSRQRCSSNSSTGSDNPGHSKAAQLPPPSTRKDINNANYPKGTSSDEAPGGADTEGGYRSVRHNHSHSDGSNERTNRGVTLEEPKPPVYTSANKFSHLMADADDLDRGSGSE